VRCVEPEEFERHVRPMLDERFRFDDVTRPGAVVHDPFTSMVPYRGLIFPCVRALDRTQYQRLMRFIAMLREPGFYASATLRWEGERNDCYFELPDSHEAFLRTLGSQWEHVFYSPNGSWVMWFCNDESVVTAAERQETVEQLQNAFWPLDESVRSYIEHLKAEDHRGALGADWRTLAHNILAPIIGEAAADKLIAEQS
jgi:hypothetical protein